MGDHPCAMAFYGAIVTALYKRERTGKGSHVSSNLMANGVWAASVLAQAKLCGAKFGERRPRERALNAVTNHYQCKDGRWLILSLLNEEKQWPTLARCLGREDLVTDPRFATKADRHARSLELIKIFDETFATKDLAEWRKILDGNGLVFGVVGILDDIPNDKQMIENEVLVPFENDTMLTINSPIWVDGSKKVQPRKPPGIGEHSDEILRNAGYDEAAIGNCGRPARWPDQGSAPVNYSVAWLAIEPSPDDAKHDHAYDDRDHDRPGADADVAHHLPFGFVLRDLAIALLVLLVGRAHRPILAQSYFV